MAPPQGLDFVTTAATDSTLRERPVASLARGFHGDGVVIN